jgi:hypothetical protein
MQTGENEQALRKIIDMTRWVAIFILVLHCYYFCYAAFKLKHWTTAFTDHFLTNMQATGIFHSFNFSK